MKNEQINKNIHHLPNVTLEISSGCGSFLGWNLLRLLFLYITPDEIDPYLPPVGTSFFVPLVVLFVSSATLINHVDLRIWERHTFEGKPEVHQQDLSAPH